jgi:hypothetical protein
MSSQTSTRTPTVIKGTAKLNRDASLNNIISTFKINTCNDLQCIESGEYIKHSLLCVYSDYLSVYLTHELNSDVVTWAVVNYGDLSDEVFWRVFSALITSLMQYSDLITVCNDYEIKQVSK